MDSLVFRCPGCQQPFQVLAEQAGQLVRCPGCEDTVQIPAAPTSAAVPTPQSQGPSSKESKPATGKTKDQPQSEAQSKAEEVQAYGCPKCEKPFGIYPSMFGSEMACPHCHQTILVQRKTKPTSASPRSKPPVEKAVKSAGVVDSPAAKPQPKLQPKTNPQPEPKAKSKPKPKSKSTDKPPVSARPKPASSPPPTPSPGLAGAPSGDLASSDPRPQSAATGGSPESISELVDQIDQTNQAAPEKELKQTEKPNKPVEPPVVVFTPQPVDHLLPPKFSAVDPAFFYRRHQDGSQVLLPSEDGSLKVVDNRIVRIEHNGQIYELISSPRYERIQRMVVTNVLAVIICGLLIAIVMTLLNG